MGLRLGVGVERDLCVRYVAYFGFVACVRLLAWNRHVAYLFRPYMVCLRTCAVGLRLVGVLPVDAAHVVGGRLVVCDRYVVHRVLGRTGVLFGIVGVALMLHLLKGNLFQDEQCYLSCLLFRRPSFLVTSLS